MPATLGDAILLPRIPTGRPIRRVPMPRNTHERLAHVARGDIVHPAMAGVPPFEREDVVLVPIDDLPPLALGLIWSKRNENATIRALAQTARSLNTGTTGTVTKPLSGTHPLGGLSEALRESAPTT